MNGMFQKGLSRVWVCMKVWMYLCEVYFEKKKKSFRCWEVFPTLASEVKLLMLLDFE